MRAFCVGLLVSLCWFLQTFVHGAEITGEDLGQSKLRSEFQTQLHDPQAFELFKKSRGLLDVAETYWIARSQQLEHKNFPKDLNAGSFEIRRLITEKPHRLDQVFSSITTWLGEAWSQPFHGISYFIDLIRSLMFPLLISLFFFSVISLMYWSPAIARDLDRIFRTSGSSAFYLGLFFVGLFAWLNHGFLIFVFFLALFGVLYSADKRFFLTASIAICLGLNLQPLFEGFQRGIEDLKPVEALRTGRTRLEYDPKALHQLSVEEKAIWATWNGAESEAQGLLKAMPSPTALSRLLESQLTFNPAAPQRTRDELLNLAAQSGENPVLLFNLVQLETQIQNLVAADEWRAKIPAPSLRELNLKLLAWDRLILPYPTLDAARVWKSISENISSRLKFGTSEILQLLSPWVIFGLFFLFSFRSSGLCIYTGLSTTESKDKLSRLAAVYQEKSDGMEPQARNRYLQEVRNFERRQNSLVKISSSIFPSSAWIIMGQPALALWLGFFPILLIWISLPSGLQQTIQVRFGFSATPINLSSGFSFSIFVVGLGIAYLIRRNGKRGMDT